MKKLAVLTLVVLMAISAYAGDLNPPQGPRTGIMDILEEIYDLLQDINTKVSPGTSECTRLIAPYGVGAGNAMWWTGLAITNYNMEEEAPCTIKLYDSAGGSGTMEITIPRRGIFTATMGQIVDDPTFVDGEIALDTSQDLWFVVESDKRIDGIVFLGDTANNVFNGYLLRKSDCSQ